MKTVVQRVTRAEVRVEGEVVGRIGKGAMLLVGVERGDSEAEADATADKIARLRFFPGRTPMDKNLGEVEGGVLVISQFTIAGSVRKGNRPSFTNAEDPELAEQLYLRVADRLRSMGLEVATGAFGEMMEVDFVNDGPVTLLVFAEGGRIL